MFLYQLKVVVAEKKLDEFVDSLRYLTSGIRKEQGCIDFSWYRDFQKKNVYRALGEWKPRRRNDFASRREWEN